MLPPRDDILDCLQPVQHEVDRAGRDAKLMYLLLMAVIIGDRDVVYDDLDVQEGGQIVLD
jgi:predicted RNA-binding protein with EMAP domain